MAITMLRRRNTKLWSQVKGKPQHIKCPLSNKGYSSKFEREAILPSEALDRTLGKRDGFGLGNVSLYGKYGPLHGASRRELPTNLG